jgi:hypothetical protein
MIERRSVCEFTQFLLARKAGGDGREHQPKSVIGVQSSQTHRVETPVPVNRVKFLFPSVIPWSKGLTRLRRPLTVGLRNLGSISFRHAQTSEKQERGVRLPTTSACSNQGRI